VRRFRARRALRLRLRGFDTLRLFFAARRRERLTEREEDAALRLTLTLAEDDGARGVRARRRRLARRFVLPLRFLDADRFLEADLRRRDLRRGTGDGDTAGAGALGTVERLLRARLRRVDRELRLRLVERARELRDRRERERDEAEGLGSGAVGLVAYLFLIRFPARRLSLSSPLRRIPELRDFGAFGVELRRRRLRRREVRLRDRFDCLTLRARGVADCDTESRFALALRFARNSSFSFMYSLYFLDFWYSFNSLSYFAFSFLAFAA